MRPFIPPTLRSFEPPVAAEAVDQHAPVRAEAYTDGYNAGLHDGHAAGMAEGQAQVRASADAELARMRTLLDEQAARQAVAGALEQLIGQRDSDLLAMAAATRTAMADALQQVFPVFLRSAMGAEVANLVVDAVAALWESQQWVRKNPKEAAAIEAEFLKVEPRIVEVSFKVLNYDPLIDDFTAKSLQTTADYLAAEKLIPAPVKPADHLGTLNKITAEVKAKYPKLLE